MSRLECTRLLKGPVLVSSLSSKSNEQRKERNLARARRRKHRMASWKVMQQERDQAGKQNVEFMCGGQSLIPGQLVLPTGCAKFLAHSS